MPRTIIGDEGGGGGSSSSTATNSISKRNGHSNSTPSSSVSASSSSIPKQAPSTPKRATITADPIITNNSSSSKCANTSNDDVDEIKVYEEEGAAEEEQRNSEINLNEDKIGLVNEAEEEKPSILSHPFSVNNLMLYNNGQNHLTSSAVAAAAAAQFGLSRNLYHPLYPSPELANLASWWPAAASLYNPLSSHQFPFSSAAFSNYNAQQAAAAAFSRFNPSFFLPPTSSNGTLNSTSQSDNSHQQQQTSNPPSGGHNRNGLASNNNSSSNTNGQFNHSYRTSSNNDKISHFNQEHSNRNPNKISHNGNTPKHSSLNDIEQQQPSKPKKPHIKKPLNAFMLFMKEQRSQVVSECTLRESAAINQILGRKWHELDRADQAKYYEMARQERLKHMQLYPGWSARDNYGLKKKRRRKREKIVGENGELPRKCRARYGLHQISLWCKPCRRKKKCIRFTNQDEMAQNVGLQMSNMNQNMGNNLLPMGYPGIHLNGIVNNLTNGAFSCGSVGEGSSGGVGSGGSLNGGNSDDDDYEHYEDDDDDDEEDCDEDDFNDDSQDSDTENKHLLHSNGNSNIVHGGIMNSMTSINNNRVIIGNSNIPGLGINGSLNIHDFSVSNLEQQKNDILIKPENLL